VVTALQAVNGLQHDEAKQVFAAKISDCIFQPHSWKMWQTLQ